METKIKRQAAFLRHLTLCLRRVTHDFHHCSRRAVCCFLNGLNELKIQITIHFPSGPPNPRAAYFFTLFWYYCTVCVCIIARDTGVIARDASRAYKTKKLRIVFPRVPTTMRLPQATGDDSNT